MFITSYTVDTIITNIRINTCFNIKCTDLLQLTYTKSMMNKIGTRDDNENIFEGHL